MIKNRRGTEFVMPLAWFAAIVIVAIGVIWIVSVYYGPPYNIQGTESGLLSDQVENCLASQGYFNDSVLLESFRKNFLAACHINFSVENVYGWKGSPQYYLEVHVYKFDGNSPGLLGNELWNATEGNPNIKTAWKLQQGSTTPSAATTSSRDVNTIVIHTTEGFDAQSAIQTISQRGLSIHYMIDRDGNIISQSNEAQYAPTQYADAFVPEGQQGEHAGCGVGSQKIQACPVSCIESNGLLGLLKPECQQIAGNLPKSQWCCIPDYNIKSIGIELVNLGNVTGLCKTSSYKGTPLCLDAVSTRGDEWQNFTTEQMNSLVNLVSDIAARYNIPLDRNHIVGHYQITTNKTDPGPAFPWTSFMKQLNARGAVAILQSQSALSSSERERSFYVTDKKGDQYIITVLALIGKNEKNVAQ